MSERSILVRVMQPAGEEGWPDQDILDGIKTDAYSYGPHMSLATPTIEECHKAIHHMFHAEKRGTDRWQRLLDALDALEALTKEGP